MNIQEFNSVKNYSYKEYCKYLQEKYGVPKESYFTKGFCKRQKISRGSEGLSIHHIYEDTAIKLSDPNVVKTRNYPIEWQEPQNLCYCDLLEHLLLHVLILKYPNPNRIDETVSLGGLFIFLIPQINDGFSGYRFTKTYTKASYERIHQDKLVYLEILRLLFETYNGKSLYYCLRCTSFSHMNIDESLEKEITKIWYQNVTNIDEVDFWDLCRYSEINKIDSFKYRNRYYYLDNDGLYKEEEEFDIKELEDKNSFLKRLFSFIQSKFCLKRKQD